VAFDVVRYLGVAYLIYMAVATWRDRTLLTIDEPAVPRPARTVVLSAILINILNPKLTIFFFAFLPQFVRPDAPDAVLRMLGLSGVFMALTFVVFVGYGVSAAAVGRHLLGRPRVATWLRRTFAVTFVAFSARLAFSER
jgi:threonine/homoserine/homoserine lactone efflux protein